VRRNRRLGCRNFVVAGLGAVIRRRCFTRLRRLICWGEAATSIARWTAAVNWGLLIGCTFGVVSGVLYLIPARLGDFAEAGFRGGLSRVGGSI